MLSLRHKIECRPWTNLWGILTSKFNFLFQLTNLMYIDVAMSFLIFFEHSGILQHLLTQWFLIWSSSSIYTFSTDFRKFLISKGFTSLLFHHSILFPSCFSSNAWVGPSLLSKKIYYSSVAVFLFHCWIYGKRKYQK